MIDQRSILALHNLTYARVIKLVRMELDRLNIIPESDIRVYPEYPTGWMATVGANARVYIFTAYKGRLFLEIEPALGFNKNGGLIRDPRYKNKPFLLKGDI